MFSQAFKHNFLKVMLHRTKLHKSSKFTNTPISKKISENTAQISISSPEIIENDTQHDHLMDSKSKILQVQESTGLDYKKVSVKQLKFELKQLGLKISGNKNELFDRLKKHLEDKDVKLEDFIAIRDNYSPESVQKQESVANPMSNLIMANINEEIPNEEIPKEKPPKIIPDLDQSIVLKVLFNSALDSERDNHMMLAKEVAFKLDESNIDLIFKIIDTIGVNMVLELFKKTQEKEAEGL